MTRLLAAELGPGVRVNALAPGLVKTDFSRALWEGKEEAEAARLPLGRLGTPEDLAHAALFLASDLSSWITGQGVSSFSSYSWATGRMTFSAKSWTHFCICSWSSLSSSENSLISASLVQSALHAR